MEFEPGHVKPNHVVQREGPLAWDDAQVLVLEGNTVVGRIFRDGIRSLRVESRRSFAHPIAGILVGGLLVAAPLSAMLGDPFEIGWLLLSSWYKATGTCFMAVMGLYLLVAAAATRQVPWIVAQTPAGERAFRLRAPVTPELEARLTALQASSPPSTRA